MSPTQTVVKKNGVRNVESFKYLPWFGKQQQAQDTTKKEQWMELGEVNVLIVSQPHKTPLVPPLPNQDMN